MVSQETIDAIKALEEKYNKETARDMFEDLGWDYDYIQNDLAEDTITYHKDNLHIQFNLISRLVVLQNDTSHMFYNTAVFFLNEELLKAINKQIEELGWDNE